MSDDTSPRLAGGALVVGAELMFIGTAVPLVTDLGIEAWTADWERRLDLTPQFGTDVVGVGLLLDNRLPEA